jgi:hypothetical protein
VDACTDAQLLVVGTRGRSVIGRAVLGSTSSYCAHHAPCPVIVVPMPHPAEGELPAPRAAHPQPEAHPAS